MVEPIMPYKGAYIAVASFVCCVAMVLDLIHGIRHKKFWMPSKYFTINSASLTVLAITVKLAMDISMDTPTNADGLAKLSGIPFICTAMANFMPSLGAMNDKDLLQDLVALGILILTLTGNMVIWFLAYETINFYVIMEVVFVFFTFCQFVILAFSAIAISTTKKEIESKYHRLEKLVIGEEEDEHGRLCAIETLRKRINMYWVMAETGSPKFVLSRAVTSSAATLLCVVSALYFVFLSVYWLVGYNFVSLSDYKWSTWYIFLVQTIGIVAGSIAPAMRSLFTVISFCSKTNLCDYRKTFIVEEYWTSRLKEWKQRPLPLGVRYHTCRKIIQKLRNFFYNFCIIIQVIIVVESKVVFFVSALLLKVILSISWRLKRMVLVIFKISSDSVVSEPESGTELEELKKYVLLLEGEVELPRKVLRDICTSAKQVIESGAHKRPEKLLKFISEQKFCFNGLTEFDRVRVPSMHLEEPPRCWSLSLSTLACVAIAIPMIPHEEKISLLQTVWEGISYARLIEKGLDTKKTLGNVGNAADILWNGIDLKRKWMDEYLLSKTIKGKRNSKEVLEYFEEISKKMFSTNKRNTKDNMIDDADDWPAELIVANSMYRISHSLLLVQQSDEMLFKRIMSMIAEILVVCLSNLPWLITSMCHSCTIEERETSVKEAARLLGATQDIIRFIQIQRLQLPNLAPEDAPYMDEWRLFRV